MTQFMVQPEPHIAMSHPVLKIFDMHLHPGSFAGTDGFRGGDDAGSLRGVEEMVRFGAIYGIERFNFLGLFGLYDNLEMMRRVNDFSIRMQAEWPGKVSSFCYINALHGIDASRRELDRCLGEGGLAGVKLELECNCRDPLFRPLAEKAIEYGVPLLQHTWSHAIRGKQREPKPSDVAWLAREYPELTIIMAHLTGCGVRGVLEIADCPNVVVDTSGAPPQRGVVESAVRILGPDRILFGSDGPGRDYSTQLGRVLGADLSDETKQCILWKNAARIIPERRS